MKILFISFEPGSGGHRLARTIATLPNVHWYSSERNGINPWNVNTKSDVSGKNISKFHFDRETDYGNIPPTHDFVEDFFPDEKFYYDVIFKPRIKWIADKIKNKYFIIPTHSMPDKLLKYNPNCKIIQIIKDPESNIKRYLKTTAIFPAYGRNYEIIPENNSFLLGLKKQFGENWNSEIKKKDLWAWKNQARKYYDFDKENYIQYVSSMIIDNHAKRKTFENNNSILTYSNNWKEVKAFINK